MEREFIKDQVTAIMPVYNEERFLRQCLESVVDQVDRVVITDNASTDSTEAICREFAEKYPHILYVRNKENLGSCKNFLIALSYVNTEFFIVPGGHDIVGFDFCRVLKKRLNENPDCLMAVGKIQLIDKFDNEIRNGYHSNIYKGQKYFMSNNQYMRAYGSLRYGANNIFFGMYRNSTVDLWKNFSHVFLGPDIVSVFAIQIKGKTFYDGSVTFYRRDVYGMETGMYKVTDYFKRVLGNKNNYSISELAQVFNNTLLENFNSIPDPCSLSERYWKLRTRLKIFRKYFHARMRETLLFSFALSVKNFFRCRLGIR
ncbi:MAG: glycosyltransferase [Bacteroidales bacterium]|jgi:glycosyltransferase involved in cell wall biosynthesis|nr:glycosyltransferase [Bacteroidales bacterium]